MSLSFKDSLKAAQVTQTEIEQSEYSIATMALDDAPIYNDNTAIMTLESNNENIMIAAYSGNDGSWTQHTGYDRYNGVDGKAGSLGYDDDDISNIDDMKNISLNSKQLNITQEHKSQFIPFEMPRYYDGYDLTKATICINYRRKDGKTRAKKAINVRYNNEKIQFGWLVEAHATEVVGKLEFEIVAFGADYIWKSRLVDKMNVLDSIPWDEELVSISSDDTWVSEIVTAVTEQIVGMEFNEQLASANDAASRAETAATNAASAATSAVTSVLNDYAKKSDLTNKIGNLKAENGEELTVENYVKQEVEAIDISEQLGNLGTNEDGTKKTVVQYVSEAVEEVDVSEQLGDLGTNENGTTKTVVQYVNDTVKNISDKFGNLVDAEGNNLTVKDYVKQEIEAVDVLDQLGNLGLNEDGTTKTVVQYVTEAVEAVDVSDKLGNLIDNEGNKLTVENYVKQEVGNVTVDLTGYATETYVDNKISPISLSIDANKKDIASISKTLGELQVDVGKIDTSPRLTYDVVYNDTEDEEVGENVFAFYEIQNEGKENEVREIKQKFTIIGGSGGSSTSSSLKIEYVTKTPLVVTVDDRALITFKFLGTDSSGDDVLEGQATWKVAGSVVATSTVVNGENTFDITEYLSIGTQKVQLSVTDDAGSLVTKSWTVQKIDVRIESTFNDKLTYPIGTVSFDYTPYGAISKDVHFILDGKEIGTVTTSVSGIPMGYTLPSQKHGSHLLEVYMTAEINNNTIESNHIAKDILCYDEASGIPVIGCVQQEFTALQYDTTNIEYTVYDPTTESPEVILAVDGEVVSTLTLDSNTQTWQYKSTDVGTHILTITCGETVKTLNVTIEKLDINVEPVTAGLVIDFNPVGKSNSDTDRVWSNGTHSMTVSDNFDWVNGGYQIDTNGDQYFCIKAGTSVDIDYEMFADDAKRNGKEMKLIFKTTNVQSADAQFMSCIDDTTGTDHIGIEMFTHEAYIYGSADKLNLKYSEDDIIEFEFNITKNTESVTEICGYEDGVPTRHLVYDDSFNFTQSTPKTITLGSDKCDLHIYRLKIYNTSLTDRGVLSNFIADARNAEEIVNRYNRNQIYDENQALTPETLAEKCPWLRVYVVSAPYFTNKKSDKVPYTTIKQIYKDGDPILDNWTCYDCSHSGQGTSSDNYGASARNLDFIMNKSQREGVDPYFILGDGKTRATKVSLTRTSIPNAYFNFKANVASSNHFTNALLAKRYNEFNPYILPYVREDESIIDYIKTTMEFYNAVVFIQETGDDLSTHREFADKDVHFYSIGNIGDSKKTDDTRLVDPDDRYEFINEICDVELPLSDWSNTEEAIVALEAEKFDKSGSYEWRYIWEDGTDEENAEVFDYCKQKWIEMYKFVVQSTDEYFKTHFEDYFVLDSVLYYYLFTTRYCMVDNRAKNSFWHFGKTGEVDEQGNPIRKWDLTMAYDCDSSMSLNNYGNSVYRHGYEDTDTMDGTDEEVFRESDSTFFCRVRDLFADKLAEMYNTLESKNAWHGESFLNEIEAWQKQFPEELWRLDCQRKYIRTVNESFIGKEGDPQYIKNMAQGRMLYAVKQWERSQEAYMASKYQSSVASSDNAVLRCTSPTGNLVVPKNYRLKLTPYDYMYLNVKYGTQEPIQVRANPGVQYEIPFDGESVDILDIYSVSRIQDLGDLSSTYPATVDTAKASRLKELHIGNSTEGYDNPYLTTMTLGANYLLEVLNVENVSGLTQSLNLSALNNLRELYAHGTNAGGVTFANGGAIQIAELPAITAMSAKNLAYLTKLDVESYDNLTTLTIENCSTIDVINIFELASSLNRVRITNIDWVLSDTALLEKIYAMFGIDKNGYNITQSVLSGKVHVPVIRQQQLYEYQTAWSDLEITFDTMIEQFAVTFVNDDGTVLEVQYVDKGSSAIDPTIRTDNPLIPTKESSISHDYTFDKWDSVLTSVFSDRIVTATYTESLRAYTIKYVSKGTTMQESTGLYGENIPYTGLTPTYTLEESGYAYYLFNRWDKSGFIDGDKIVNAIFDKFEYTTTAFDGKELDDLTPVEIYAMNKLGLAESVVTDKDKYSFVIGNDIDYDDIESELIISDKVSFTGSNYLDTGIKLFDEDRDFVLAIDYEFLDGNSMNSTLAQCFQSNGSNGFKLWYNSGVRFTWGTAYKNIASANKREMVVIRHQKGNNNLMIYNSNLDYDIVSVEELVRTKTTTGTNTLVFGCARADDGIYENFAIGNINWCKVWYKDLGDTVCQNLAMWTHEKITLESCGFRKYYLSDNSSKRCSFSLLANHLLNRNKKWSSSNNTGGWGSSTLNTSLNNRLYNAIPSQIRSLIKQVKVPSSLGAMSTEVETSDCYITIPACIEVDSTMTTEPYINEGSAISYMATNEDRKRAYDGGDYASYWLRSPNASYSNYVYQVNTSGKLYGFTSPSSEAGVLIEISF